MTFHLHDNSALGAWKSKLLKTDFKLIIVFMETTKMHICENGDVMCIHVMC